MPTISQLKQERAVHIERARGVLSKSQADGRSDLNSEEQAEFDKLHAAAKTLKTQIDREEAQAALETDLRAVDPRRTPHVPPGAGTDGGALTLSFHKQRYQFAVNSPVWNRHQANYREPFRAYLRGDRHAVRQLEAATGPQAATWQTDSAANGGYFVAPEEFNAKLLGDLDNMFWLRKLARTFAIMAQTMGTPNRTARATTWAWGSELTSPTADDTFRVGKRVLSPHYMTGEVDVSNDLLRSAVMDVEEIVRSEMAYDAMLLEEQAFLTGSGAQRPLGLFTASSDGISTGRDVSTGNTTTAITADGLIAAKFGLKAQYRASPSIGWLFHRDAVKNLSLLKDGDGQYLWRSGLVGGEPDRLLNYPVYESEYVPNTFTTGQYVGLLGDYRYFWICDGISFDIMVVDQLLARTNQTAYIARRKVDAMPVREEAFSRVKLA